MPPFLLVVVTAILLGCLAAGACAAEHPPGERGSWTASTSCAEVRATLTRYPTVTWLSPARFDFILDEVEAGQAAAEEAVLLAAKADAQAELITALRAHVVALEGERAAREDERKTLKKDLAKAEGFVISTPRRPKWWAALGFVAGAGVVYVLEN